MLHLWDRDGRRTCRPISLPGESIRFCRFQVSAVGPGFASRFFRRPLRRGTPWRVSTRSEINCAAAPPLRCLGAGVVFSSGKRRRPPRDAASRESVFSDAVGGQGGLEEVGIGVEPSLHSSLDLAERPGRGPAGEPGLAHPMVRGRGLDSPRLGSAELGNARDSWPSDVIAGAGECRAIWVSAGRVSGLTPWGRFNNRRLPRAATAAQYTF